MVARYADCVHNGNLATSQSWGNAARNSQPFTWDNQEQSIWNLDNVKPQFQSNRTIKWLNHYKIRYQTPQ